MGSKFAFECPDCGYSAVVSGGRDFGMMAVVQTMVCQDCKHLVDVLIGRFGEEGPTGDPDYDAQLGRCPDCEGQDVHLWQSEHPCPKCGVGMTRNSDFHMLWD